MESLSRPTLMYLVLRTVMYWWDCASKMLLKGEAKRFGFITTNSITQPSIEGFSKPTSSEGGCHCISLLRIILGLTPSTEPQSALR